MNNLFSHKHGGAPVKSNQPDFSVNISPIMPPIGNLSLSDFALHNYPSIDGSGIRDFYVARFGLDGDTVLPTNGAIEAMYLVPRALGVRRVLTLTPSFHDYERASLVAGATVSHLPLDAATGFALPSLEQFAKALQEAEADALFIGNPNNPTGTAIEPEVIMALASRFPWMWFIVDEAFIQFTANFPHNSLMKQVSALRNIIVVHSLTKFYALPGLRLGTVVAHPDVINRLLDVKEPWTVNAIAEEVARHLLRCSDYDAEVCAMIATERERIIKHFARSGEIVLVGGAANFFLARWIGGCSLDVLFARLAEQDIYVRDCRNFKGLEANYFRFAIRTPEENNLLLAALLPAIKPTATVMKTTAYQRNFSRAASCW